MRSKADDLRKQAEALLAEAQQIESQQCTGVSAAWCPLHGDCSCPEPENALDDWSCPLHSPSSTHAEASLASLKSTDSEVER